jgi:hypothetical protein
MEFILVVGVLSLAIFVCISDTVFDMAASLRTHHRSSRLQKERDENESCPAGSQTS